MGTLTRLINAGWTVEQFVGGYAILTRKRAKRIVLDIQVGVVWVSGYQE